LFGPLRPQSLQSILNGQLPEFDLWNRRVAQAVKVAGASNRHATGQDGAEKQDYDDLSHRLFSPNLLLALKHIKPWKPSAD
jgi:hypothetical protein